ncbi:MAG: tyrosine-type recombinase/integrase [Planctomycetota bacterium]
MRNLQSLIYTYADERMKEHSCSTRKIYVRVLLDFDHFQNSRIGSQQGRQHLQEESLVLGWLRNQDKLVNTKSLGLRLRLLRDFLEYLKGRDLIDCNVIDQLYKRYPLRGWRGLAEAGKGTNPAAALEKLRPRNRFKGPWGKQMCEFILFKRRLGAKYEFEERTLANLDEYLVNANIPFGENFPPALINQWLLSQTGNNEQTLNTKRRVAKRFFEHLRSLGLVQQNPAGGSSSAPRRTLRPYIFSKEQIQQILYGAECMPDIPFFPHRGTTYQMVFATLYCLGLRINELCHLCLSDIDFDNGLLLIRPSKFYKTRLLPLGPKYLNKMKHFVEISHVAFDDNREEVPLFLSYYGKRMRRGSIGRVFRNLANQIGLKPKPGQRGPSLHSFRHTFAVHRLLRWYRQGEDVQAKLPLLSAFLGHVDIGSTQIYLDMIPELLEQVHLRFESHCGNQLFNQGGRYHERR